MIYIRAYDDAHRRLEGGGLAGLEEMLVFKLPFRAFFSCSPRPRRHPLPLPHLPMSEVRAAHYHSSTKYTIYTNDFICVL